MNNFIIVNISAERGNLQVFLLNEFSLYGTSIAYEVRLEYNIYEAVCINLIVICALLGIL